jgi:enoyl-CoA hydratase/carnithine racemase
MSAPKLRTSTADGICTITLDDPPANTYSYEMMQALDAAILAARMDASVHVIVITGAGEKFFCAGANIGMLKDADPTFKYYFCLHANETLNRLEQTPKLVIAALNGHTVGGGLEVAMAADLRIARQGGGKIGMPEVALGVLPGTGGTQRFARIVGKAKAIETMATGALFSFEEARDLGLVNHVWGDSDLNGRSFADAIHDYAKQFTPPNKAAKAVGHIKRAVQSGLESGFSEGLALERELQQRLFESDDAKEGLSANLEKRKPNFSGR